MKDFEKENILLLIPVLLLSYLFFPIIDLVIYSILILLLYFGIFYIQTFIHEFGHALFGKAAGIDTKKIIIGNEKNKLIYKSRMLNFDFEVYPGFSGLMIPSYKNIPENNLRARLIILYSGGILLEIISALILIMIFGIGFYIDLKPLFGDKFFIEKMFNPTIVFFIASISSFIMNIIPAKSEGKNEYSDGAKIISVMKMKTNELTKFLIYKELAHAEDFSEKREYQKALDYMREQSKKSPEKIIYLNYQLKYLIKLLRLEESESFAKKLIETAEDNENKSLAYFYLSRIYFLKYFMNDQEITLLTDASFYALKSMNIDPDNHQALLNLSYIQIEQGKETKAISVLEKSVFPLEEADSNTNNPLSCIFLSYAYSLIRETEKSGFYQKLAEKMLNNFELENDDAIIFEKIKQRLS